MNQLGPNASATIGTYNDVKGSQTNYTTIYAGSSQEQEDIATILRLKIAENPGGNQHETCTANTRVQIRQDIREWAEDINTTKQIFWLVDRAGTGKSTVAKQVVEDWESEGKAIVSFVFSITAADTKFNSKFCQTIAAKLADLRDFGSFRLILAEVLRKNLTVETLSFGKKFENLLRATLKKTNKPVLVVIDALDECDKKDRSELLSVLLSNLTELPMVKILITSRPEPDIVEKLRHYGLVRSSNLQGSGNTESTTEDILRYVSVMFADSRKLQSFQPYAPKLAQASNGIFLYASTAYKYLENSLDPKAIFQTIEGINGLDGLYSQIMERAVPENDSASLQAVHSILQVILAAQRPLSVSDMQKLLKKDRVVQSVIEALASVLSSGAEDTPVEILHPTFPEYLTDRDRSGVYFVDVRNGHKSLAISCLEICGAVSAAFPKNRFERIAPILEYALLSWPIHAAASMRGTNAQEDILLLEDHILSLFRKDLIHWFAWVVLLKAVYRPLKNLAILESSIMIASTTATYPKSRAYECQRWCRDSQRFLQHHQSGIEQWHNDIRGAIAFTPKESLIYKAYFAKFARQIPAVLCGIPTEWPSHQTLSGHIKDVIRVIFSPDGTRIASSSFDQTLQLWDSATGASIGGPMQGHTKGVICIVFSPNGTRIASSSFDQTLRLWDGMTGASISGSIKGHTKGVISVAFSPDGTRVVSGSWDHTLRLWDGITGASIGGPIIGHLREVNSVAFSPDGTRIVSGSWDHTLRLWDGMTGVSIGGPMSGHTDGISTVAFSPDGNLIISTSSDCSLRLWDGVTGASVGRPMRGHTDWIMSVAFSPDGTRAVSSSRDQTLRLWDVMTSASIGGPMKGHTDNVSSVAFSSDGTRIVSGSWDHTLRLWDGMNGANIGGAINGHTHQVNSVAFSPDDTRVVSGSQDHTLRLWDAVTGATTGELMSRHTQRVSHLAFSPDGTRVVSGSDDNTLRLWDAVTGASIGVPLRGHTHLVRSVAFSPDGTRIVSSSQDHTLRLWNGVTGENIGGPIKGHTSWIIDAVFSPDGTRVISRSDDKTFRLWRESSFAELSFFRWWDVSPLTQVAVISTGYGVDKFKLSTCGSYAVSDREIWDIRSLPPRVVTGIKPDVSTRPSFPIRYYKESRTIELHHSSLPSFHVPDCHVSSWTSQGGRIALGLEDGRVVIIDYTHLL